MNKLLQLTRTAALALTLALSCCNRLQAQTLTVIGGANAGTYNNATRN